MRAEDNRFYWLSTSDISGRFLNSAEKWSNLTNPAMMTARINPEANEIHVHTTGLGQVTVWLGRNSKGQTQIDFDKTITVRVGLRAMFNRKVTPSLAIMLEDLAKRGDRKHLFLARIDMNLR
jgi:hypothetical protein